MLKTVFLHIAATLKLYPESKLKLVYFPQDGLWGLTHAYHGG